MITHPTPEGTAMELIATIAAVCAVLGWLATWAVTRRDLGDRRAVLVGLAAGLLTGLAFLPLLYLAVLALLGALGVYLVVRRLLPVRRSALAAGGAYALFLAGGAVLLGAALETM
jgi:hypothetical protein